MRRLTATPWTTFCYSMIAGASLVGSVVTAMALIAALIAGLHLLRGTRDTAVEGRSLALALGLYFIVLTGTTALNGPIPTRFIELVIISPFLYFIPLALLLPALAADLTLRGLGRAAMIGTVTTAVLALVATFGFGVYRPGLATGNANVVSGLLILQSGLCVAGWWQAGRRERLLIVVSVALGVLAVALSTGSRGALISGGAMVIAGGMIIASRTKQVGLVAVVSMLSVAAVCGVLFGGPRQVPMLSDLTKMISDPGFGDWVTSDGMRMTMYKAALAAITDNPWIGVGMHQRFSGTLPYYAVPPPDYIDFTHVHNLILTHGVAGGLPAIAAILLVVAAPVVITLRSGTRDPGVLWVGIVLPTGFFALGLTETVLFQDLNTTFVLFVFLLTPVVLHQTKRRTSLANP